MKRLAIVAAVCAGPLVADPLDLVDYEAVFEQNAADVEEVSETRSLLRVGDIALIRDPALPRTFAGIDESGQGAVGCYVTILATIESALLACEGSLPAAQSARQKSYLEQALAFYAENTIPPAAPELVRARYDALVASQIEGARPFCSNLDLVTDLADRIFSDDGAGEISDMLSIPRLPVEFPCL